MSRASDKHRTLVIDIDQCMANAFILHPCDSVLTLAMLPENLKHRHRLITTCIRDADDPLGYDFAAVKRPGLDAFLRFCETYFDCIIVWTAADCEYGHSMVREIYRDHRRPDLILTRDDVERYDEDGDMISFKPLRVINAMRPGMIDLSWTFILDDTYTNFREDPGNALHIPQFMPDIEDPFAGDDRCFLHLMEWLQRDEVRNAPDVRRLDKSSIFSSCAHIAQCARCASAQQTSVPLKHHMVFSTPGL